MSTSGILAGCRDRLLGVSPRPAAIRWMEQVGAVDAATPCLSDRFAVLEFASRTIGGGGPREQRGTYMIDIRYPVGDGAADLHALHACLDAVLAAFAPGAPLLGGASPVSVIETIPAGPIVERTHILVSVTARWQRFPPATAWAPERPLLLEGDGAAAGGLILEGDQAGDGAGALLLT